MNNIRIYQKNSIQEKCKHYNGPIYLILSFWTFHWNDSVSFILPLRISDILFILVGYHSFDSFVFLNSSHIFKFFFFYIWSRNNLWNTSTQENVNLFWWKLRSFDPQFDKKKKTTGGFSYNETVVLSLK